ncbi:unnamed protein product [Victoria cruziana]
MVRINDLVPSASTNINTEFILLDKGMPAIEGPERVCLALVADETAAVHFQFWGGECDAFERGDIIRLTKGIFSFIKGKLLLRAGRRGKIEKIGEFTMLFVETPNISDITWSPDPISYVRGAVLSRHSRLFPPLP